MDGVLNLLQSVAELGEEDLSKILQTFQEHQSFRLTTKSTINPNLSFITSLLNTPSTRESGLLLLDSYLPQCTLDVLEEKGGSWIMLCVKTCSQKSPVNAVPLAYEVLKQLIKKSIEIPELQKSVGTTFLQKIIESTVDIPESGYLPALQCLEVCMKLYSGSCGSQKKGLERFCFKFVDSNNEEIVQQAAKCCLLLQQIRGGGNQRIIHKNAWALYQTQLIRSIHNIYDLLFANISETFEYTQSSDDEIPKLPYDDNLSSVEPIARAITLFTRFKNLCTYLEVALLHPYPVAKSVQPVRIFALITRGLSIDCTILSKNLISDNIAIGSFLPNLHICLYKIVNSLILVLKGNLLLQSRTICDAVEQTLKWTASGKANGLIRPYRRLRIAAYQTLSLWCRTMKYASGVERISENLIVQILHDITPFENEVKLKILRGASNLSKKAKKRLIKAQNEETNLAQSFANSQNTKQLLSDDGNQELCEIALKCLNDTLTAASCFIKPVLHKVLHENIVTICLTIVSSANLTGTLFENANCRKYVYECLATLILSAHHLCPPPTQYASTIFSISGITDKNSDVRDMATNKLRIIEKILHPNKESFYFSTDINSYLDAINKKNLKNAFQFEQLLQNGTNEHDNSEDIEMNIEAPLQNDSLKPPHSGETITEENLDLDDVVLEVSDDNNENENKVVSKENGDVSTEKKRIINVDNITESNICLISDDEADGNVSENSIIMFEDTDDDVRILDAPPTTTKITSTTESNGESPAKKPKMQEGSEVEQDKNSDDMVEEIMSSFIEEINENLL